jgi:hypothetical protein
MLCSKGLTGKGWNAKGELDVDKVSYESCAGVVVEQIEVDVGGAVGLGSKLDLQRRHACGGTSVNNTIQLEHFRRVTTRVWHALTTASR